MTLAIERTVAASDEELPRRLILVWLLVTGRTPGLVGDTILERF
jgi:hypothetical protein